MSSEFTPEELEIFDAPKIKPGAVVKPAKLKKSDQREWIPRRIPLRFDWIKPSTEARARVRLDSGNVMRSGDTWLIVGQESLSDRFDEYRVSFKDGKFSCTCQGHAYGDSRFLCTHALAAILHGYEPDVSLELIDQTTSDSEIRGLLGESESTDLDEWAPVLMGITWLTEPEVVQAVEEIVHDTLNQHQLLDMMIEGQVDEDQAREWKASEVSLEEWKRRQTIVDLLPQTKPAINRWPLPECFSDLRDHQWTALVEIIQHWANGRKFVFLDAPTGAGKSLLGCLSFLEWAGMAHGKPQMKGFVAVTSLDLQDQMARDFEGCHWFAMIKGRGNYPTANFPERYQKGQESVDWDTHIDCSDCEFASKKHCRYCNPPGVDGPMESGAAPCLGRCPYKVAFKKVVTRPLGMTNMQYLLRIANSNAWGVFEDRKVLVADECDTMEGVFMGWITVEVSEKLQLVLGDKVGRPSVKTFGESAKADWFAWAGRAKARIAEIIERRRAQIKGEAQIDKEEPGEKYLKRTSDCRDLRRDVDKWIRLSEILVIFMDSLEKGDPWVYDGYQNNRETGQDTGPIIFKPVRVNMFCKPKLFDRFDNVLMMSATLISADQIARDLGIESSEFGVVRVPRTFDPSRGPIYVCPVADNSMKERANSWPRMIKACEKILTDNPNHRVMIHAVSYEQSEKIFKHLKHTFPGRWVVSHSRDSFSKKKALETYEKNPGAVLISPSMARGADFKGDLCRVQIIIKVPFPYLGDKQISARLHGTHDGQLWYSVQTIREIVQMTGRVIRSEDDWGSTWILDSQFMSVWSKNSMLFPEWWRNCLKFVNLEGLQ